jgi:hypothetical protein
VVEWLERERNLCVARIAKAQKRMDWFGRALKRSRTKAEVHRRCEAVPKLEALLAECLHPETGLYNLGKLSTDDAIIRARALHEEARDLLATLPAAPASPVTRYSCRNCWSQDIDKLLADCRAVLEDFLMDIDEVGYPRQSFVERARALLARLPERKEASDG